MKPPLPLNAWMRYDLVRLILRTLGPEVSSVLEIGAGEGAVGARLASRFDYVGLERDPAACARAQARLREVGRGRMLCGDLGVLAPDARFDLVCSFEVLEHIEDDAAALAEWRGRVREGGWLLLSAPAHQRRFGPHDRIVGHYRRYDPDRLALLLAESGYADPVVLTCGFPFGYALEVGRNAIGRLAASHGNGSMDEQTAASGRWLQPPDWIGWLTAGVAAPFRLLQRPFARTALGTGVVALARRPA
ncbi:MAG TPA: methyltransferase domain-containing protein [Gaiellaceae bacterium]|nr:methyltransferase domain-containing protein [Gaiellaceae bacterium]